MKNKIYKAYKFRIYPTKIQVDFLNKQFGAVRFIYNYFLNQRDTQFKETGKSDNYYAQTKTLKLMKGQEEFKWLKEINSQTCQQALQCLDAAYLKFFRNETAFPRFKKKKNHQSFCVPQHFKILEKGIIIPKLKSQIKCKFHREIIGEVKSLTISKTPIGKYFVSILVEQENKYKQTSKGKIGIDLGIKDFVTLSDGTKYSLKLDTKSKKLKKLQHYYSKKQKNSKRKEKLRLKIAKIYEKITNSRLDFQHKLSNKLTNEYQTICLESLKIKNMMKNHKLAKAIGEASWYSFVNMLQYKGKWKGCDVIQIDQFYPSSKTCSVCNWKKEDLKLSDRSWICPNCGTVHDRDINAAKNILTYGLSLKSISSGTEDNKRREAKKSSKRLKVTS
jgi:putative transposase